MGPEARHQVDEGAPPGRGPKRTSPPSRGRWASSSRDIGIVYWLTDWKRNEVLYVSGAYETVWERSCESLYEDAGSWADLIHPDDHDRVHEAFAKTAPLGTYDELYRLVLDDGSVRWIHDRAFPIRDGESVVTLIAGISEDVTARVESERTERREERERAVGRFAGGAADVLVEPIAAAGDAMERLRERWEPGSEGERYLEELWAAFGRMEGIASQLLAIAGTGLAGGSRGGPRQGRGGRRPAHASTRRARDGAPGRDAGANRHGESRSGRDRTDRGLPRAGPGRFRRRPLHGDRRGAAPGGETPRWRDVESGREPRRARATTKESIESWARKAWTRARTPRAIPCPPFRRGSERLGGSVSVETRFGAGMTYRIRLPLAGEAGDR